MSDIDEWLVLVLGAVSARGLEDFSGLGLVFYTNRAALPVHPLVPPNCMPDLPAKTVPEAIEIVAEITRRASALHDGFHLVDARTLWITDVSQFLAPPIPGSPLSIPRVSGARHMAARLASLLPSVSLAAVWAGSSDVCIYERGFVRTVQIAA